MYEIDDIIPDEGITSIQPGTNLLIKGPPMIGKHDLALELLATGFDDDDGILCVTTNDSATAIVDSLSQREASPNRNQIGIVSCSGQEPSQTSNNVDTEFVSSPSDLTGISIGIVKIMKSFSKRNISSVRHGVLSVSTLQQYLDTKSVFKFLHIYTSRVRDTDGLGVCTLHSSTQNDEVVNTLSSEFDGIIELRETDDASREIRLTGIPTASRSWYTY
jgi:KaiC/GvpD/RAD55 family RecA-like ATPase